MLRPYTLTIEWYFPDGEAPLNPPKDLFDALIFLNDEQKKLLHEVLDGLMEPEDPDAAPMIDYYTIESTDYTPTTLEELLDTMLPFVEPQKLRKIALAGEKKKNGKKSKK